MLRGTIATVLLALVASAAAAQTQAPSSVAPRPSASPSPSAAPAPAPASARPVASLTPVATARPAHAISIVDGAFSLPGGIWKCETLGNSQATSVYKLENPHTITERTVLSLPKRPAVELDTLFTFSPSRRLWTASLQNGLYAGTAPVWSGDTWTFDGTYIEGSEKKAVRLVYTSLGEGAMRIDYQAMQLNAWRTFSGATCKRTIP